jgi:hypothetical protein
VDRLIRFLFEQPLLLIVLLAWVAGILGNIAKVAKRRRERAEQEARQRHGELPSREQRSAPAELRAEPGVPPPLPQQAEPRSSEQIAREMRRILGMEEPAGAGGGVATARPDRAAEERVREERRALAERLRAERAARERAREAARAAQHRRDVAMPERPPVPVVPTTASRRLEIHVDPHVGERIQHRGSVQSGRVGTHAVGHELGQLGGRSSAARRARTQRRGRYTLDDLDRIIVLSEILGPPLALRGDRQV